MKKTINRYEFIDNMLSYYDGNGFTYEGLSVLFDYLEEYEEDTGEELELDVVALHCQYSEMTVKDFITDYLTVDEIETLKYVFVVEDIDEITSDDIMCYYNLKFNGPIIIICLDYNTIIVDTSAY